MGRPDWYLTQSLDFELWDAGLAGPCQRSALPSGQSRNVMGVPWLSPQAPRRHSCLIGSLQHSEVDIADVAIGDEIICPKSRL